MCDVMGQLGVAIDGGKDSLSMAARVGTETVKAPGTLFVCLGHYVCFGGQAVCVVYKSALSLGALVISVYAVCPDITATVTPDLENPDGQGLLLPHTRAHTHT